MSFELDDIICVSDKKGKQTNVDGYESGLAVILVDVIMVFDAKLM